MQPGETLTAISAGDTVRWVVGDTTSGTGTGKQVHVLVKPFAPGLKTNLVITTDRRSYHLELESTDQTYMAALSWTYPQDGLIALQQQNDRAEAVAPIASGLSLGNLQFRYAITGDSPPWRPVRAFDDGTKVYIEFPARIDQGEAPPLFVVGPTAAASSSTTGSAATTTSSTACSPRPSCASARTRSRSSGSAAPTPSARARPPIPRPRGSIVERGTAMSENGSLRADLPKIDPETLVLRGGRVAWCASSATS